MKSASVKRNELLDYIDADDILIESAVNPRRIFRLNDCAVKKGKPIVYVMSREQRVNDNWGLLFAQNLALENEAPLVVLLYFNSEEKIYSRHLHFMLQGARDIELLLKEKNIPFYLVKKNRNDFCSFLNNFDLGALVVDFSPLDESSNLNSQFAKNVESACFEVDSHNIIPARFISNKQEFSAATLRPKVKVRLGEFLTQYPTLKKHPYSFEPGELTLNLDFSDVEDTSVTPVDWIKAGEKDALKHLKTFIDEKLDGYSEKRNDPTLNYSSNMSIYLKFGHISSQRIALEIIKSDSPRGDKEAYLEELIVRKELADNFCLYNKDYKRFSAFNEWAQFTLNAHRKDIRSYEYSLLEFEKANTHDELWNAAQKELVKTGKIHSYLRMYWCKKILEWCKTPEFALETAIYLNDKYALDGCEANGYTGIAWSIGGIHDRPWSERSVFGKIRYMNYQGCKRKFDVASYIGRYKDYSIE